VGPALGLAAIGVLLDPHAKGRFQVLLALQVLDVFADAPVLGSHWMLALFVAITLATAHGVVAWRTRQAPLDFASTVQAFELAAPALRVSVVAFYSFAAFAKLNVDFLDPATSCAVNFFRSVAPRAVASSALLGEMVVWLTVAIELALPVLLALSRTRTFGAFVALLFHFFLAADPAQHVADFSTTMYALLLLFLPFDFPSQTFAAAARGRRRLLFIVTLVVVEIVLVTVAVRLSFVKHVLVTLLRQVGWLVYAGAWLFICLRYRRRGARERWPSNFGSSSRLVAATSVLVVANGLLPYTGLKNSAAFNMYSNLDIGAGYSNHVVVRRPLEWGPPRKDMVRLVAASDEGLSEYVENRMLVPSFELQRYLGTHPDVTLTFETDDGSAHTIAPGVAPVAAGTERSWLVRKLLGFRPMKGARPVQCVRLWGPLL
jgi:hypothetical protein